MPKSMRHPRPWLRAFWQRAYRENVTGLSAMVAYNLMLAIFPFALLILFVFGQVLKIGGVETSVLGDLKRLFPNVDQGTLSDVLNRIVWSRESGVGASRINVAHSGGSSRIFRNRSASFQRMVSAPSRMNMRRRPCGAK